jgi:hypothetical protein
VARERGIVLREELEPEARVYVPHLRAVRSVRL